MTNDDHSTGLATTKRNGSSFGKRIADKITVGHLLAAGVLAGFGAGFGSHALVGMLGDGETIDSCRHGAVVAPFESGEAALGIYLGDVARGKSCRHGHGHDRHGVIVRRVVSDSPADSAGLRSGDVIVEIDGDAIRSGRDLRQKLRRHDVADHVTLHVHRGDRRLELDTKLGDFVQVFSNNRSRERDSETDST